jgi:hypothetical protein
MPKLPEDANPALEVIREVHRSIRESIRESFDVGRIIRIIRLGNSYRWRALRLMFLANNLNTETLPQDAIDTIHVMIDESMSQLAAGDLDEAIGRIRTVEYMIESARFVSLGRAQLEGCAKGGRGKAFDLRKADRAFECVCREQPHLPINSTRFKRALAKQTGASLSWAYKFMKDKSSR